MIPQRQLSLADIFEYCKETYESNKPQFLALLENHIDLDEIVPISFQHHYTIHLLVTIVNNTLSFDYSMLLFYSNRFSVTGFSS